ncbi:hypothetical protein EX30DRAFT_344435 [Ascodesmis nigricans]|uniref:Uncharacterized protein n=1 Tax=Ascodesmis nigricans TaxID=341454 RepID=A0A4S2MQY5_9PEZI|nr:hypothetical protein EX30DRAFT_344435 [Ascodesmis nigricans]
MPLSATYSLSSQPPTTPTSSHLMDPVPLLLPHPSRIPRFAHESLNALSVEILDHYRASFYSALRFTPKPLNPSDTRRLLDAMKSHAAKLNLRDALFQEPQKVSEPVGEAGTNSIVGGKRDHDVISGDQGLLGRVVTVDPDALVPNVEGNDGNISVQEQHFEKPQSEDAQSVKSGVTNANLEEPLKQMKKKRIRSRRGRVRKVSQLGTEPKGAEELPKNPADGNNVKKNTGNEGAGQREAARNGIKGLYESAVKRKRGVEKSV